MIVLLPLLTVLSLLIIVSFLSGYSRVRIINILLPLYISVIFYSSNQDVKRIVIAMTRLPIPLGNLYRFSHTSEVSAFSSSL